MFLADTLTLDAPKRTKEGFLAVRAKAARAGVYDYKGCEIDPEGKHFAADQTVKVYRSEAEVFAKDAVHSFLLRPVTDNHPKVPVTSDNWTQYAKGVTAGAIRDGEYLAFDLVLMDAAIIAAVDSGKRELSNGYQSEIEIGDGVAPDGTAYQATQRHIRGNHVAVVDKGRAGSECRIGDVAVCDTIDADVLDRLIHDGQTYRPDANDSNFRRTSDDVHFPRRARDRQDGEAKMPHVLVIDGLQVPNVSDEAKAAIEKLQGQAKDASDATLKAEADAAKLTKDLATKDGEIAALEQKVKDAEVSPEKLEQMVADRAALVSKVKAVDPDIVTDGKSDAEIRKALVEAKLGDAAKDMDEAAIGGAFKVYTKDAKANDDEPDTLRSALRDSAGSKTADKEVKDAYDEMIKDMLEASKPKHLQTA